VESHVGMILMGNTKNPEKNLSQCHFVQYKSHWTNLSLCSERLVTNHLSHGTAFSVYYFTYKPIVAIQHWFNHLGVFAM
jgi:hypothetical protein